MTYLLDVNSLLALGVLHHEFHERGGGMGCPPGQKGHSGLGYLLDHRVGLRPRPESGSTIPVLGCPGARIIASTEGRGSYSLHIYSGRAPRFLSAEMGQKSEANYRWSSSGAGKSQRRSVSHT